MEYIVQFNESLNQEERTIIIQECGAEYKGNIFGSFELVDCPNDLVVTDLLGNSSIVTVEVNGEEKRNDVESPDFPTQLINVVPNAHEHGYKGDDVVVAIVDSGLNYDHEDLQFPIFKFARILDNTVVTTTDKTKIKDDNGHGTAVASIVAMPDNGLGYVGVAPNAKMTIS